MTRRFISIWFRYLATDWFARRQSVLRTTPFVLRANDHGRAVITAVNLPAAEEGLCVGMSVADAEAMVPGLHVADDIAGLPHRILTALGHWCIRFTPVVALDLPGGLLLDVTGCAHLWGGEEKYLAELEDRLTGFGYHVRVGLADTVGAAWAAARYGRETIIAPGAQATALFALPPSSLRLTSESLALLSQLGLSTISTFIGIGRHSLQRRFGPHLLEQLDKALGRQEEFLQPLTPIVPHQERLQCLEPILTRGGIEIALERLLDSLCQRLRREDQGLRTAVFKCYRIDGDVQQVEIGTSRVSCNTAHLFKLLELKLHQIEPALGIELFVLDATNVEKLAAVQEHIWGGTTNSQDQQLAELLDRLEGKFGSGKLFRYLPAEHHPPELAVRSALSLKEKTDTSWRVDRPRPVRLLSRPELVEVSAPIPDYPPMLFRYKDQLHRIKKADGPERIESEWWIKDGAHRDYYIVEDEEGRRYWLFRLGHYDASKRNSWFLHGFFA